MSKVQDILSKKGNTIWSVSPETSVYDTLQLMAEKNVGAVLILEQGKIAGIFSERDFARNAVKENLAPKTTPVKSMMTSRILVVSSEHTTDECMSLMTAKHIRHLPVMDDGKVVGLISIGDVVSKTIDDHKFSITQLERYVSGGY